MWHEVWLELSAVGWCACKFTTFNLRSFAAVGIKQINLPSST